MSLLPAMRITPTLKNAVAKLALNPITQKELKGRVRGARAYVILCLYILVVAVAALLVYSEVALNPYTSTMRGEVGRRVFLVVTVLQAVLVCFVAPASTASAFTGERERQTYDILLTTLLSARQIVWGKLIAAVGYIGLLVFGTLPLFGLAYWLGGVELGHFLMGLCVIFVLASFLSMLGVFVSVSAKTTLTATVVTYIIMFVLGAGLPLLLLFGNFLVQSLNRTSSTLSTPARELVRYSELVINPIAALIASEELYTQSGNLWLFDYPRFSRSVPWLASTATWPLPVWVSCACYLLLMLLLYGLAVRKVRRRDKT